MTFLDSYKKLDNLCKDIMGGDTGITAYITKMENCRAYSGAIKNWDSDYKSLKHYRYIRNMIVHEDGASEDKLCDKGDAAWLNAFYKRILAQTDPLAQYRKLSGKSQRNKPVGNKTTRKRGVKRKRKRAAVFYTVFILVIIALIYAATKLLG